MPWMLSAWAMGLGSAAPPSESGSGGVQPPPGEAPAVETAAVPAVPAASEPSTELPPPEPPNPWWSLVALDGRDYVTAEDVARFYAFDRRWQDGPVVWFRSLTSTMRWEVESNTLTINEVRYLLSHRCVQRGGAVLIARVDLVKLIDPVLRPVYLASAGDFDTVVIDPGHGGLDNGTRGLRGDEKLFTFDLGMRLRSELEKRGLKVVMTRETDFNPPKIERAMTGNRTDRSIFISLHFNQEPHRNSRGLETYVMTPQGEKSTNDGSLKADGKFGFDGNFVEEESLALATAVHSQLIRTCRCDDRAVRRGRFAVVKYCQRPAILIEGGYISNVEDAVRIATAEYRTLMAQAIADGVVHFRRALGRATR